MKAKHSWTPFVMMIRRVQEEQYHSDANMSEKQRKNFFIMHWVHTGKPIKLISSVIQKAECSTRLVGVCM